MVQRFMLEQLNHSRLSIQNIFQTCSNGENTFHIKCINQKSRLTLYIYFINKHLSSHNILLESFPDDILLFSRNAMKRFKCADISWRLTLERKISLGNGNPDIINYRQIHVICIDIYKINKYLHDIVKQLILILM